MGTFESDGFWADLGGDVLTARDAIEEGTADGRERAVKALGKLSNQITVLKVYFQAEQKVLERIVGLLTGEDAESVTLDTVLAGVRTTSSEEDKAVRARKESQEQKDILKKLSAPVRGKQFDGSGNEAVKIEELDPWTFEEVLNEIAVTVTVPVPAETKRSDVDVCIEAATLRIAVKGHSIQPTIVDGELSGAVDPEASAWSIEGSGEKRRVVVELEKKMGGFMWTRLLKA